MLDSSKVNIERKRLEQKNPEKWLTYKNFQAFEVKKGYMLYYYVYFSLVNTDNLPGLIFEILILIRRVVA